LTDTTSRPRAWITGAAGLIGNYLVQTASRFAPGWRVRGLTRAQLDLLDFDAVRRAFREQRPQLVIHCAAMSRSPECQQTPTLARQLNVDATANLAELAADIPFVFCSTDLVFDGCKGDYVETDAVNPLNVYAETKVAAERFLQTRPRSLIVRLAINGGRSPTGDRGFNELMRLAWQRGEMTNLFTDEFRCPIPAVVTARAIWELVNQRQTGLFHLGGGEKLSRYEIGKVLSARTPELAARVVPDTRRNYRGAPRPADVSLNLTKIQRLLSFHLPGLTEWLAANPNEPF
jgi:dTDP-4-dehydrorhamnose reductase